MIKKMDNKLITESEVQIKQKYGRILLIKDTIIKKSINHVRNSGSKRTFNKACY